MFNCDQCGECCRNLHLSRNYADLDRGDGVCRYLEDNLCTIYLERPLKCRVDDSYEKRFKSLMTKEEYYQLSYEACTFLKQLKPKEE